jgi:hypothetical protein
LLTIPRRAGASGSRVVEVVHLRSGGTTKDRPRRVDASVRAASWEGGFPAKRPVVAPILSEPVTVKEAAPISHVMPAWESAVAEEATPASSAQSPEVEVRQGRGRPRNETNPAPTRRVADPFDTADDGANCMRCGYVIETAREKRGLMTCTSCA